MKIYVQGVPTNEIPTGKVYVFQKTFFLLLSQNSNRIWCTPTPYRYFWGDQGEMYNGMIALEVTTMNVWNNFQNCLNVVQKCDGSCCKLVHSLLFAFCVHISHCRLCLVGFKLY